MNHWMDWIGVQGLRGLVFIVNRIPEGFALGAARVLGRSFFYFSRRRHLAYADLKAAFGRRFNEAERWKIVRESYESLAQTVLEILRFSSLHPAEVLKKVKFKNRDQFEKILRDKNGGIILTAHFGNWELEGIAIVANGGPLHVLARTQKFPLINEFLNKLRESNGSVTLQRGMGVRGLLRCLRQKKIVGILGDQDAGKNQGVILPFFGRKTTVPTGAFEMARRSGVPLHACFIIRTKNPLFHEFYVDAQLKVPEEKNPESLEKCVQQYLDRLEGIIGQFPEQWLWTTKRWKYSWTKRILILSDGKPGHEKQSLAVAQKLQEIKTQYGRAGMETPTQILSVKFRTRFHKLIFSFFSFFFIPFAQGRLNLLAFFFEAPAREKLRQASADFVISAGASLVGLNLSLARESCAKSIVLMKPAFPFNLFRYDLALIPRHDQGLVPRGTLRLNLTPSVLDPESREEAVEKFAKTLKAPERVGIGVFLGGPTRRSPMPLKEISAFFDKLEKLSDKYGDYVVTTSRRTPREICENLIQRFNVSFPRINSSSSPQAFRRGSDSRLKPCGNDKRNFHKDDIKKPLFCQSLVIASEDPRPEVAPGIMGLAEILIVTEDSVSMISEAVSSGKKVLVLRLSNAGLPQKHKRFQGLLERESALVSANLENLESKLEELTHRPLINISSRDEEALSQRLKEIL